MKRKTFYPGTKVPAQENSSLLAGIFSVTNGITLSQVCEITGTEATTIQNWIKRGYVKPPVSRKYSKSQVARIVLINMMREAMVIEKIAGLLTHVNGNLLDTSDDILDDSKIYDILSTILVPADIKEVIDIKELFREIDRQLELNPDLTGEEKNRLRPALRSMVCAHESSNLMQYARQTADSLSMNRECLAGN